MPSTCQDFTAVSVEQDQTAKIIQHDLLLSGYPDKKKKHCGTVVLCFSERPFGLFNPFPNTQFLLFPQCFLPI